MKVGDIWIRNDTRFADLIYKIEITSVEPLMFNYLSYTNTKPIPITINLLIRDFRKMTKLEKAMK